MAATSEQIQRAMHEAAILCAAEGIRDPDIILERKLAAREDIKRRLAEQETIARMEAADAARS